VRNNRVTNLDNVRQALVRGKTFVFLYLVNFAAPPNFERVANVVLRAVETAPSDETAPVWISCVCAAALVNHHRAVLAKIRKASRGPEPR